MAGPSTSATRIAALLESDPDLGGGLVAALVLPDDVTLSDVLAGAYPLSASDLVAAADALDVPVTVLSGSVPLDRHLGVSLRLGRVDGAAGVPADALTYVDVLLGHSAVLDSWLGPVESPLAGVAMHTDDFRKGAGEKSADRVRRVLRLGSGPVGDLVGLVERLGFPVVFRDLPEGLHGLNVRDERDGTPSRVVVVSTRDGWPRQRFTLAHELCHALYDDPGQVIVDTVDHPEVLTELRAEAFARELLLPRRGLRQEWDGRAPRVDLGVFAAQVMTRWGLSRDAVVRCLVEDGLATEEQTAPVSTARVAALIARAGLTDAWAAVCGDEHTASGSPLLVDRATRAYGNGWVGAWVVAEILGADLAATEAMLAAQGWLDPGSIGG